ncbi:ankyrin repeat domain-containing protein [Occallatibacter savannae]|uniref:ankyrin repeat domain-containing protein n=1 Tax=Occallatibacter savannae TaxID=1002691 RepID=UPI000D68B1A9|nr:ankyrin repeat domain-containing protein [Occallatibacter savannae]
MPVRPLPPNPNLEHLKYQARDLKKLHAARDRGAAQRMREFHPQCRELNDEAIFARKLSLSDAQLTIARERGFKSWPRLKEYVDKPELAERIKKPRHELIEDPAFRHAVDLLDAGDAEGLREHLKKHKKLVHQRVEFEGWNYFRNPTLLEFVAENPIRRGTLPNNIVDVARVILDAGPDQASIDTTLALAATGSVALETGATVPLIELLCEYGADPNDAINAAALHGSLLAVRALLQRGARMTLAVAAALNDVEGVRRLLGSASKHERHIALAMASQIGWIEVVRVLLDAGEDPNRYNPIGGHSHTTPLHQAALIGNDALVRLLLDRGADPNTRDLMWNGTPADWARHERHTELEAFLRGLQKES